MNSQVRRQVVRPNKFVQIGLPFIGFVVAGSLGLSVLVQGRKDAIDARSGPVDELRTPAEKLRAKKFDITEEYEVGTAVCACRLSNVLKGTGYKAL